MLYVNEPLDRQINRSIEQLLKIDGIVDTDANVFATEVLLNTWLEQIKAFNPRFASVFWDYLRLFGLKNTISNCANLADDIITAADSGWYEWKHAQFAIETQAFDEYGESLVTALIHDDQGTTMLSTRHDLKTCLQVLRYAKRFTWPEDHALERASIREFLDLNHAHGVRDLKCRSSFYYEFLKRVQEKMEKIYKGFVVHYQRESALTSGTSAFGSRSLSGKLIQMSKTEPTYRGWIPWSNSNNERPHVCEVVAVPKNYKKARVIAMEDAHNVFYAKAIQEAIRRCFKRNRVPIFYDDQTINREGARLGALNGRMATIDHTAASDSIPYSLGIAVTPRSVREAILSTRSDQMWIPNKKQKNPFFKTGKVHNVNIWLTSGHPCTWDYESTFFLSVAESVRDIYIELTGDRDVEKSRVFGDDLEVDVKIYDLYCEIMEYLDFKVNREKSFKGEYRESCGVEYLLEQDTTTIYFPRKPLTFVKESSARARKAAAKLENCETIASLISLQHALFFHCPEAANYLTKLVRYHIPDMTCHKPGTDCADLWGYTLPRLVPYARNLNRADCPEAGLRELHYTVSSRPAYPSKETESACKEHPEFYRGLGHGEMLDIYSYTEWLLGKTPEMDIPCFHWIDGRRFGLPENRQTSAKDVYGSKACWVLQTE